MPHNVAGDGREAVEAVHKGSFDVMLMDVQMPEMDGYIPKPIGLSRLRECLGSVEACCCEGV